MCICLPLRIPSIRWKAQPNWGRQDGKLPLRFAPEEGYQEIRGGMAGGGEKSEEIEVLMAALRRQ